MTAPVPPAHLSFMLGTFRLGPGLFVGEPDDYLGVLAAQLYDGPGIRIQMLHRQRDSVYFLDELCAYVVLESVAAAARNEYAHLVLRQREEGFLNLLDELIDHLGLLGIMTFVFLPEDLIRIGVHNNRFYGR